VLRAGEEKIIAFYTVEGTAGRGLFSRSVKTQGGEIAESFFQKEVNGDQLKRRVARGSFTPRPSRTLKQNWKRPSKIAIFPLELSY
jgi:hypothetical protein